MMPPEESLLHFEAGGRRFALPVTAIAEIREAGTVTPVPGTPAEIAGLIDMRGRIVTLMDLAAIFGLEAGLAPDRLAIQLAEPHGHLALLVPAAIQDLRTDSGHGRDPGGAPGDREPADPDASRPPLGRELLLVDGAPVFLLDLQALAARCTQSVRERFRVAV